ncbi:MAG: hypothetical protein C0483_07500 [Pirellula sp.]|nr:hypothetical protein [Pirellula sp.]
MATRLTSATLIGLKSSKQVYERLGGANIIRRRQFAELVGETHKILQQGSQDIDSQNCPPCSFLRCGIDIPETKRNNLIVVPG